VFYCLKFSSVGVILPTFLLGSWIMACGGSVIFKPHLVLDLKNFLVKLITIIFYSQTTCAIEKTHSLGKVKIFYTMLSGISLN
jgi:hypothetical protein